MTRGSGQDPLEELLALAVVVPLLVAGAAVGAVWLAAEAAGLAAHRTAPPLGLVDAVVLAAGLPAHWRDPSAAYPAAIREAAAVPAALFWPVLLALLALLAGTAAALARRLGRQHRRGARLARPRDLRRGHRGRRRGRGLRPGPSIFLGWYGWPPLATAVRAGTGEHAGAVAPPGYGKTAGQHIGAVVAFEGAVVSATTKPDVLLATADVRRRLAARHGGELYALDLGGDALGASGAGLREARIDLLAGCDDPMAAEERAAGLVPGAGAPSGDSSTRFFDVSAVQILKALIHAAALRGLGVRAVIEWAMSQDADAAAAILVERGADVRSWAAFLEGLRSGAPVTVAGQWATVQAALAPLQQPRVLRLLDEPDFDVDRFLRTRSTLYVVDPRGEGGVSPTAYVIAAYLDWIKERAYRLALERRDARHRPLLLLAPDELAQVAPLKGLPGILAQGPGRGVVVSWATQSFGQLAERYGEDGARAVLSSTHVLLVFGGLDGDVRTLDDVSRTLGEVERIQTHQDGTTSSDRRPLLSVADLVGQPAGEAYAVRAGRAVRLRLPPLPATWRFRRLPRLGRAPAGAADGVSAGDRESEGAGGSSDRDAAPPPDRDPAGCRPPK